MFSVDGRCVSEGRGACEAEVCSGGPGVGGPRDGPEG